MFCSPTATLSSKPSRFSGTAKPAPIASPGFAAQTPGEDAVFGVRFTEREDLRSWEDLLTADKDLGLQWAVELIKRGILVNPNEKFYIS